jgi:hypothetical protein
MTIGKAVLSMEMNCDRIFVFLIPAVIHICLWDHDDHVFFVVFVFA